MGKNAKGQNEPLFATFVAIGKVGIVPDKSYEETTSASGFKYRKLNFRVTANGSNNLYLESMGGHFTNKQTEIKVKDIEKNDLLIAWNDRFDKNIIKNVADYCKTKTNFLDSGYDNYNYFLSDFDFIEELKNNLVKDLRVVVTGKVVVNRFKTKQGIWVANLKYNPTSIRLADDNDVDKIEGTFDFIVDKESMDDSTFKEDGKIDVSGYMTFWDKAIPNNIFVPMPFVFDSNYSFDAFSKTLGKDLTDVAKDAIVKKYKGYFNIPRNEYHQMSWKVDILNGTVAEEVTEADFNDDDRFDITCGIRTAEEIKKAYQKQKGGVRVSELKLIRPVAKFDVDDSDEKKISLVTEFVEDDFIIPEVGTESKEDLFKQTKTETTTKTGTKKGNDVQDADSPIGDADIDFLEKLFPTK